MDMPSTYVLLLQFIYPEDPKTKMLGLDFNASNVNIGAVVKHIWSSTPAFLLDFISPIAFSDVAIGYHADKYTILAHPDALHSPLLAKVLEVSRADRVLLCMTGEAHLTTCIPAMLRSPWALEALPTSLFAAAV